jgi:DNA gyrase/topoisomerase IV subunit A
LIGQDQIEEWIHEVEERPATASIIVRFIANRLRDLTQRNEELLAENIELRSNKRVDEYEARIANLEYQLAMLKRQIGGELHGAIDAVSQAETRPETISLLLYLPTGQVLRSQVGIDALQPGQTAARRSGDLIPGGRLPRLAVMNSQEELLFVFDTGRTVTMPVDSLPQVESGDFSWQNAATVEPVPGEELAAVIPVGRLALADFIIQASRRGCVKKMMKTSFETHLAKKYIGAGIITRPDLTCTLAMSGRDDHFVMASREGMLLTIEVSRLPFTIEETIRLAVTDYITSAFVVANRPTLLVVTTSGKAIYRESKWLEPAGSFKSRGQAIYSQSRREAGTRVAAAAAVDEQDWSAALVRDGSLVIHRVADLLSTGALPDCEGNEAVVDFAVFTARKESV